MTTLLSPPAATDVIRELTNNRKHLIWENSPDVNDRTVEALVEMLASAFLVEIFTPTPSKPQYKPSLRRINARFNVRASGEVTRAYLMRQMDLFIGGQRNASR